ncbi:hypothetical protein [Nocardiopsis sp. FR26]|uniref:hypothetical protein n=1 Tax=Nocardiopsis sp. FR26 TaxID=2605987 RepID=UPI00135ABFE6|nr:hypothetical protein [Nocardiopsis sp. FR26]
MSEPLWIAVITASAALGGALITALITFTTDALRGRREERHRVLQERRETYKAFAAQAQLALEPDWKRPDMVELLRLCGRVHVVGSQPVAAAADHVVEQARAMLSLWSAHSGRLPVAADEEAARTAVGMFHQVCQNDLGLR